MDDRWSVYIVRCADGALYTGATNDVAKRLKAHNAGKGAKYTRSRRPVKLVCCVGGLTRGEALSLECRVKRQRRQNKVAYLEAFQR